ncbi:hypothetical protein EVAR_14097_1 [Eumeta japonica]|uniref:Uncharacterized protein n=1 Tax=Eumeta variegata TaxID=151549 RepID=A0A4C1UPM0_EUMVA|nr:hypothetical protein EVAR_14097_1 [Eumeta japonica]
MDGKDAYLTLVVPKSKVKVTLEAFYNDVSGKHLGWFPVQECISECADSLRKQIDDVDRELKASGKIKTRYIDLCVSQNFMEENWCGHKTLLDVMKSRKNCYVIYKQSSVDLLLTRPPTTYVTKVGGRDFERRRWRAPRSVFSTVKVSIPVTRCNDEGKLYDFMYLFRRFMLDFDNGIPYKHLSGVTTLRTLNQSQPQRAGVHGRGARGGRRALLNVFVRLTVSGSSAVTPEAFTIPKIYSEETRGEFERVERGANK